MYKSVYKHLLFTYGRRFGIWFGLGCELVRTFIVRVYVVIVMAQVATSLAAGNLDNAKKYTLYYLVIYIAGALIGTFGKLVSIRTENAQYEELMKTFHKKLVTKDMSFFRDNQTGYLASAYRQYLDSAMLLVRFWRGEALGTVVSLIAPVVVLLIASPKVGLIAALVVFLQVLYVIWTSKKANKYRELTHEIYRKVTGLVSDEITNMVAFKSGGSEKESEAKVEKLAKQESDTFTLRRNATTYFDLPRNIITAIGISLAVYIIIDSAKDKGPATLGLIVLTLTYMFQIIRNVTALPQLIDMHDDNITKIYPTLSYLTNDYEEIKDPADPKELVIKNAEINFIDISFSYSPHDNKHKQIKVFEHFNLIVKGGEQVGVVGISGAGKTTLANLLLRFDDINNGSITIDGIDIRDVRQHELRQNIAYVPQEPLLFHSTVRDNIAYYNPDISKQEVVKAAKAAHAHDFIQKLPYGYDTIVGERGIKLSGGQKQRIAIARVISKKAPIILFDEATSALDSDSEQIIQKALPEILGKHTAIIIAHRLSTVAKLDRIIVISDGKIIEEGSHKELLREKGKYYSLWKKQTSSNV